MGNLGNDLGELQRKYAGAYLLNKFFIKIATGRKITSLKDYIKTGNSVSIEDQKKLQAENSVTLYHEYIHYIHEISTMCGITQFYFEAISRSLFSAFVDVPIASTSQPVTGEAKVMLDRLKDTLSAIYGGSVEDLDGQIVYDIYMVELEEFNAYAPFHDPSEYKIRIPNVTYEYADPILNIRSWRTVYFGKFYLYEGIAHHVDQLVTARIGAPLAEKSKVKPEYKIMEQVARFVCPEISERSMLEIASLSLSYWNCGEMFIRMLQEASSCENVDGYILEQMNEVSATLTERRDDLLYTLEQIKEIFKHRTALFQAANYLCNEMISAYDKRISNPKFEVDVTYSGQFEKLADYVKHCDLMYEFTDNDQYLRDFVGTYTTNEIAGDLKTFMCHVDYYQYEIAKIKSHCCPLYTFCPHQIRQERAQQCKLQPRLAYESQPEYGWCNYGLAVAYMKGQDNGG